MPLIAVAFLCLLATSAACRADGPPPADDQAAVLRLISQLEEAEYPGNRTSAAGRLGELGARAKDAVPALLRATEPGNAFALRDEAMKALGAVAPEDQAVLRRLGDLLSDRTENGEISATARRTLAKVGAPAIPVLVEKLEARWDDSNEDELLGTWSWAAMALGEIARPALPAVLEALNDPSRRLGAVSALRSMGREVVATEAGPALIALAKDPDWRIRCDVLQTLGQIGPQTEPVIRVLTTAAREDPGCGEVATRALSLLCPSPSCPAAAK